MIKIEYYKKESEMMVFNQTEVNGETQFEFLGNLMLKELTDMFLELDGPVARPRFGSFLYQAAAMLAHEENKYLCLPRDGDVRAAAEKPMVEIDSRYRNKLHAVEVPEIFNDEIYEFTNEDESPHFFNAYQIEPTNAVKNNLRIIESKKDSVVPKSILNEWGTFFNIAYESDSNKFLDEEHELIKPLDFSDYVAFNIHKEKKEKKRKTKLKP